MTDEESTAKRNAMLQEDLKAPRTYWWLSFADPKRPEGSQFLGATVVEGGGFTEALAETHLRGINPGGEVRGTKIEDDGSIDPGHLAFMLNTLRTKPDLEQQGLV